MHSPAGRIVDMDDAAMGMPAFAGEVEITCRAVERNAQFAQPVDGLGCAFDNEFDCLEIVQPCACDHRITNMVFEGVACIQDGRDAALGPGGRSAGQLALGENEHFLVLRQFKRCGKAGGAGSDDEYVVIHAPSHAHAFAMRQEQNDSPKTGLIFAPVRDMRRIDRGRANGGSQ